MLLLAPSRESAKVKILTSTALKTYKDTKISPLNISIEEVVLTALAQKHTENVVVLVSSADFNN